MRQPDGGFGPAESRADGKLVGPLGERPALVCLLLAPTFTDSARTGLQIAVRCAYARLDLCYHMCLAR